MRIHPRRAPMFVVVLAALALVTRLAQAEIVEPEDLHYGLFEAGVGHITDVEALVDVRSYIEFDTTHIEGAYNVDIRQMRGRGVRGGVCV